jgi:hypothetical protein
MRVLLFLLPFVLYGAWLGMRRLRGTGGAVPSGPLPWLIAAALGLALVGLGILGHLGGAPPGARYVPPHEVDGRIVPGHFEKGAAE